MSDFFDDLETRDPDVREADLFRRLPGHIGTAMEQAPGLGVHLSGVNPADITSREALAKLPVLRKMDLMDAQKDKPPFGGFTVEDGSAPSRVFLSPGPIWEPQGEGSDPWLAARALFAAGFRPGDVVHNSFAYHMTPGGFIFDTGARALGCSVFPAGVGNTEMQVEAIAALRPRGWSGTPDYLKVILDKAREMGADCSSIEIASVGGGALFPAQREEYASRGVSVLQTYATADLGIIAFESEAREGMIVNEQFIVEIVRPGTGEPVAEGEVGEMVVTTFNRRYPLIRFATGDLSAVLPGLSPCGRTGMRIKGWMGRADQRTKIKGMFVDPAQVDAIIKRHPEIARARLVVMREGDQDAMVLNVELKDAASASADLEEAIVGSLRDVTKLSGRVAIAARGALPNDGKVIADERSYE
ncbi:AMP-binding protein [Breoghania sp. L-A4]|uniref:phenylacetate--CoA ligase family protein n=1 Tax=Breoghania sp. L-A4 TaxID=2304600 RepID=UPI000E35EDB2|nr:AMP-binding protein [Breoghania sp. L-A4]AXS41882.1 phenylacetate--CoA ligase family protein [Breoghania sp. L-A4]